MGNEAPKISVIVPVYKVEKYLRQCVDSILAQTFTDFELLLIDDGSPDSSGAICDEYASQDSRVRVFHKENGGPSAARNLGLDNARGEWIAFVDSDDTVKPHYLQTFIDVQQEHNADLVVTGLDAISENVHRRVFPEISYEKENIYKFVIFARDNGVLGIPWNKFYSSELIHKFNIIFDESLWSYEDEVYVVKYLLYASHVHVSSAVTYNHYKREEISLSRKFIPLDLHYKVADILYQYGSELSNEQSYIDHLNDSYARHLSESVDRLYWSHNHFSRKERLEIIASLIAKAKEKNVSLYFYNQLRKRYRIYARGVRMIEFNGTWNKYAGIKAIKSYIKACLPNNVVNFIRQKKAKRKKDILFSLESYDEKR